MKKLISLNFEANPMIGHNDTHNNPSDAFGAMPNENLNWSWLQNRLPQSAVESLDGWLECELSALESSFARYTTFNSLRRNLRQQIAGSRT